ncbi:GntR family transcriptional regulator [Colwellia sp. E2M01]|uniref:GntR family transcriptional regulator n=1 Tax=Colwellia sp. E2M01 TaxID=2841561 RepID=UPI001C08781C|nr:GntR family transcriptional regulator [Colwellia sp. E2M01]MBU2869444.1 GntR family transcriptional regulator [Colwellia sp. E2M01]
MNNHWHDDLPIYKQLVIKLKNAVLDGSFAEGQAMPSVRAISAEMSINHITVSKAYHELLDNGLIEKKRGLGMFVLSGAQEKLLAAERQFFIEKELPMLVNKMNQLDVSIEQVIKIFKEQREGS